MNEKDFLSRDKRRPRVRVGGRTTYRSHVLWNQRHPGDPVKKGEVVHHKDEDVFNDAPENHEKMTKTAHDALHRQELTRSHVQALAGKKQPAEQIRKRVKSIRGTRKWDLEDARRLEAEGMRMVEIEGRLGVSQSAISHWCKRNGVAL